MPLTRGARLGPYRIDAEIGVGGMGHVWRATDTRLDRSVAIKVLPPERWTDPELRRRFEREARALSSLSHPNLCPLYDVGEVTQDGAAVPYLVMELLEGETLRHRLDSGPLSIRKALLWAAQIANGLAAAHQKGLIHRDLKPDNVFITGGELLKILDFGLATTTIRTPASSVTQPGIVMGTTDYMSPEQVRGLPLDARSDIFSLGILLFEMLTGRVPFHASSIVETMNAILVEETPDLTSIAPAIPEAVDALVRRCLEKDPANRFSSARDLAFALETAAKSVTTSTPSPVRRRSEASPRRSGPLVKRLTILGAILAAIIAAAVMSRGTFDEPDPQPPIVRTLTYSGRDSMPAASPDGRLIAYVSSRDGRNRIWLKQLADGTEVAVTAGPQDSAPRFAPDGSVLLFTRTEQGARAIYRAAVLGGEARKLIDDAFDGDWSPDGKRIAFIRNRPAAERFSTLCVASRDGGAIREIAASTQEDFSSPRWSPNGRWIAVTQSPHATSAGSILLIDPESGEKRVLSQDEPHGLISGSAWVSNGAALIYAALDAHGTDIARRRGSSSIVLHDVGTGNARVLLRNAHSAADTVDVVGPGRIIFSEDVTRQSLQEVLFDGSGTMRWLSRGLSMDRQPAYARGGTTVMFASDRGGNVDLWEVTLADGSLRRLTDHSGVDWDPHPGPDGKSLYWSSNRGGHFEVWTAALDGANPQQVTRDGVDAENPSLPAAGDWIYYDSSNPKRDGLWRVPRTGGEARLVVAGETIHPEVSADGTLVVYQRPEAGGAIAVDVVRVADGQVFSLVTGITRVPTARARWIGASHTVAFRANDSSGRIGLFTQDFRAGANTITTRRRLPADGDGLFESFAISADGRRGILSVVDEASGIMIAEKVDAVTR